MTTTLTQRATLGRIRRILARRALVPAAVFLLAGCSFSDLLQVRDPDIVTPDNLNDSTALPTIRASAVGDFAVAYSGSTGGEGVIMTSGLLSDELINSETFPTRIEVDRRGPILEDNATTQGWFRTLSRARRSAEFAVQKYRALAPDTTRAPGLSEVLSLAGFGYIFFAENYCSGVPISAALPTGELVYGRPLTTTELLDTAIARFDQAIAAANALTTPSPTLLNLARLGRARAQLDRGDFAGAATTVTAVPTSFVYFIQHTENSGRENNGVFIWNEINERYSLGDREGDYGATACIGGGTSCVGSGVGMPFRSVADPRTPFRRVGTDVGFDGQTPQFDSQRYIDRKNFVTLATGAEARLIEAENFLRLGDATNWLARHNALRAAPPAYFAPLPPAPQIPPLAALADPGTVAAREDLHFSERARWLWLTAHRLSDMRRFVRQYGRAVNAVFPSGAYLKQSFTYGPDVNFPIPVDERNNPEEPLPPAPMCIDRNP
ncbi:MAG: hypothetical protein ACREL9_09775 [Gemmatimonadales bacterium]